MYTIDIKTVECSGKAYHINVTKCPSQFDSSSASFVERNTLKKVQMRLVWVIAMENDPLASFMTENRW